MSVSRGKTAQPVDASKLEDWKALRWGELPLDAPPRPAKRGSIPYLTVREMGRLYYAKGNLEAKTPLVESYRGMQSAAFNAYKCQYRRDGDH